MSFSAWLILFVVILSTGTLFFSVNAIALRVFSRVKLLDILKATGKEKLAEDLTTNVERMILICSLCRIILNTCILLLLTAATANARQDILQISDYLIIFVIATMIFSVFSWGIPHAWAKYAGEKILCRTYSLLMFFTTLGKPILSIFNFYDGLVRRLAGVPQITAEEEQEERQEEFLNGLEQRRIEGVVDEEEQEMIENVLELSDTNAAEIMTPRTDIVAIESNSNLETVLKTISTAGHTRLPVYEENIDNIIGFIYAKDLLAEIGKNPAEFKLCDKLRKPYFIPETKPLRALLHEFQNQKLHIAVLLDEYGGTAGIATLEDILEELVGEITDEYEKTPPEPIKKIDKNTIEVDARTYIDELNDEFELDLPESEDYDTIGGFVLSHLGYIPKTGKAFNYKNLNFTVIAAEARRIRHLKIHKTTEPKSC